MYPTVKKRLILRSWYYKKQKNARTTLVACKRVTKQKRGISPAPYIVSLSYFLYCTHKLVVYELIQSISLYHTWQVSLKELSYFFGNNQNHPT